MSADGKADVKLTAYESDLQVTGGVNANVATGGGTAVGGSITVADIDNNLDARIHGGSYTNIHTADAESLLATRQITAAISTGVAVGGNGTNNAFTGAMIYNGLHNDVKAGIDGGARVTADTIAIRAHDTTSGSAEASRIRTSWGTTGIISSLPKTPALIRTAVPTTRIPMTKTIRTIGTR